MRNKFAHVTKNIGLIRNEAGKIVVYKNTIQKQEDMIMRLEKILQQASGDTKELRERGEELKRLRDENSTLKDRARNFVSYNKPEAIMEIRTIVKKLDAEIEESRERLRNQRPRTSYGWDQESVKIENEIKLKK